MNSLDKWTEIRVLTDMSGFMEANARSFTREVWDGVLKILVGTSDKAGWHLSISHTGKKGNFRRLPNWDEIKGARYDFVPDAIYMAIILPPKAEYVNLHPTCMQMFEFPKDV